MFVQTRSVCLKSSCSSGPDFQRESKHQLLVFIVILLKPKGNLSVTADKPKTTGLLVVLVPKSTILLLLIVVFSDVHVYHSENSIYTH